MAEPSSFRVNGIWAGGNVAGSLTITDTAATLGWSDIYASRAAAGVLGLNQDSTHGVRLNVATDATLQCLTRAGADSCTVAANTFSAAIGNSTSAKPAPISSTDVTTTTSGTVQNTVYTLNSVTIPADAFGTTGQAFVVDAWGTFAANGNAKDIFAQFAGATIASATGVTANGSSYYIHLVVTRVGANSQRAVGFLQYGTTVVGVNTTTLSATDASANAMTVGTRNTAAAAESGTGLGMTVLFMNQ